MTQQKILVVGDIFLDQFVYGSVDRISPEAPIPILKKTKTKQYVGGCGNVAMNLRSLRSDVYVCAAVGDDTAGRIVKDELENNGIHSLLKTTSTPTIVKTRYVSNTNKHMLRVDDENSQIDNNGIEETILAYMSEQTSSIYAIVVSDYDKGTLSSQAIKHIVAKANECNIRTFIDSKKKDSYDFLQNAYLFKPNLSEFSKAVGVDFSKSKDLVADVKNYAKRFIEQHSLKNIIVTLSEKGMLLVSSTERRGMYEKSKKILNVYDVSGAGDTILATIVAATCNDYSLKDAMKYANKAGSIVVQKLGTSIVSYEEVFLDETAGNVFYDIKSLKQYIDNLRQTNKLLKIGFTNGCFDCCHYGHVQSFIKAKNVCDVLVVGINSDNWIKKHKGQNRPLQDQLTRVAIVSSLRFVDCCIVFDDDTACNIVEAIRPDIIAKQGYSLEKWPEAKIVKSYGGEVLMLDAVEGYSTTNLERKMYANAE